MKAEMEDFDRNACEMLRLAVSHAFENPLAEALYFRMNPGGDAIWFLKGKMINGKQ